MAKHAAERGSLVVFEPSASSDEQLLLKALRICHILKYSRDRFSGLGEMAAGMGPDLIIETQGAAGLHFFSCLDGAHCSWQTSESLPAPKVLDAAGCGDWCSAGIIHMLGREGLDGFRRATRERLQSAIRLGQALASWNCAFEGARGGMYRAGKAHLQQFLRHLLDGEEEPSQAGESEVTSSSQPIVGDYSCLSCGVRPAAVSR
ncbi:MAG: hypothetical protein JOZ53_05450 [Planctomycetaceae bacterium]|nr:hypothetical protein [Planctomycetaceae bacterium]